MFQLTLLKVSKKKWKNPRAKCKYAKPDNMYTLESQEFSNQLHFALYGETWTEREARIKKENEKRHNEEKKRHNEEKKRHNEEKMKAIQRMLKSNKLSIDEIVEIMDVSIDVVKDIKEKMEKS